MLKKGSSGMDEETQKQFVVTLNPESKGNCIPESFNTDISHQLFNYNITFVNSTQIQKVILHSKKILLRFGMTNSINTHPRLKISYTHNTNV